VLFPSIEFAIFLCVVLVVSWTLAAAKQEALRKWFLLLASLAFYAFWNIGFAMLLAGAVALPFLVSNYRVFQFNLVLIYAIVLLGLNILTGYNGQISLGHGAFYAIGAYSAAIEKYVGSKLSDADAVKLSGLLDRLGCSCGEMKLPPIHVNETTPSR